MRLPPGRAVRIRRPGRHGAVQATAREPVPARAIKQVPRPGHRAGGGGGYGEHRRPKRLSELACHARRRASRWQTQPMTPARGSVLPRRAAATHWPASKLRRKAEDAVTLGAAVASSEGSSPSAANEAAPPTATLWALRVQKLSGWAGCFVVRSSLSDSVCKRTPGARARRRHRSRLRPGDTGRRRGSDSRRAPTFQ